jgi:hypothetical protein
LEAIDAAVDPESCSESLQLLRVPVEDVAWRQWLLLISVSVDRPASVDESLLSSAHVSAANELETLSSCELEAALQVLLRSGKRTAASLNGACRGDAGGDTASSDEEEP